MDRKVGDYTYPLYLAHIVPLHVVVSMGCVTITIAFLVCYCGTWFTRTFNYTRIINLLVFLFRPTFARERVAMGNKCRTGNTSGEIVLSKFKYS